VSLDTAVDVRKLPFVTCPNPRGYRPSLGSCDFSIRLKLYGETTYFQNRLIVMQCIVPKDWKLDLLAVLRENVHSFFLTILAPRRDTTAEVNIRRFKTKFQVFCPMLKLVLSLRRRHRLVDYADGSYFSVSAQLPCRWFNHKDQMQHHRYWGSG